MRVEAGRLRGKLREYYDTHGATDPLRIELPKGGYVPRFVAAIGHPVDATATGLHGRDTLLVLPFKNLSGEAEQAYFADGLSEDLIAALSRLGVLTLIARQSSFHYRDLGANPAQIGRETAADYLLAGSVRRAADRVRVSAQLIATSSEEVLWSDRYDRELTDIFALQDEVVASIVRALEVQLVRPLIPPPLVDIEAYDLVSRGRECFWSYRPAEIEQAQHLFAQAVAMAPDYALAHVWRCRALTLPFAFHWQRDRAPLDEALAHARTAVRIAPDMALAHAMIAWTQVWRGDTDDALAAGSRAVELDEGDVDAHVWYAVALAAAGRGADASRHAQIAQRLEPHAPAICIFVDALAHWLQGDLDAGITRFSRSVIRAPDFVASYLHRAVACAELGDRALAVASLAEVRARNPVAFADLESWTILTDSASRDRMQHYQSLAYAWFTEDQA